MGCHLKAHRSLACTTKRNICDKYEEMKSRQKKFGGFKRTSQQFVGKRSYAGKPTTSVDITI